MTRAFARGFRALLGDRRGTPALEFALVAPLFFATVFATFELGRAFYNHNRVAGAVSLAARTAFVVSEDKAEAAMAAITDTLWNVDPEDLLVEFKAIEYVGRDMTEISITLEHDFLIQFTKSFTGMTLNSVAYVDGLMNADCDDPNFVTIDGLATVCVGLDGDDGISADANISSGVVFVQ